MCQEPEQGKIKRIRVTLASGLLRPTYTTSWDTTAAGGRGPASWPQPKKRAGQMALASCSRRVNFSQPCGARFTDLTSGVSHRNQQKIRPKTPSKN